jgi:stage II sporulation protein D
MRVTSNATASLFLLEFKLIVSRVLVGRRRWISTLLWILLIAPAQAALELRVAVEEGASQVRVGSSTPAIIRDSAGRALGQIAPMDAFYAQLKGSAIGLTRWQANKLWVEPSENGYVFIGDRWYRGRTLLTMRSSGITAVNYVDLEEYLYSVVGSEMGGNWPQEALKAQAVAARSYALYKRETNKNPLFDVVDTVASQAYKGLSNETVNTQQAVKATEGEVLSYNGKIIQAVFHSSSGGHTENVEDVWTRYLPYLRGVPDYDQGSPAFQWNANFSNDLISQRISGLGRILSITPGRISSTGRAITIKVSGTQGTRVVDADTFRSALGLKSTWFSVTPTYGQVASAGTVPSLPASFQLSGRGFGHGLGMSQWGAYNLAQQGYKYKDILSYYYKGTKLAAIDVQ